MLAGQLIAALAPPTGLGSPEVGETTARATTPPDPKRRPGRDQQEVDDVAKADHKNRLVRAEQAVTEATELFTRMSADADAAARRAAEREQRLGEAHDEVARVEVALDQARDRSEVIERELADARRVSAESKSAAADAHQRLQDAEARIDALRQ